MNFRRKPAGSTPPIWQGVYESFDEVPRSEGHASREWLDALAREVEAMRNAPLPDDVVLEHEALLFVLRTTHARRVLDFGGGAGQSYAFVRRVAPELDVRWTVVELPEVVALGRTLLPDVTFTDTPVPADVIFIKSALQYLDDWRAALRSLFALNAPHLILEKFSGVASRSYVTAQTNFGATVPYRFIAFDELFAEARAQGYERALWRRLPRLYDQSNFDEALRMGQASTIVFAKV
ncbi:MAG TPA: methyltransferase, TIGR04325 family [Thermoanaerobaculia bacterium]|nr:methyltransferase, TIGR04325 family [Thermoanaerobaculia bacterium]